MHNKLEIRNLHIIMYLSGKKEQMLRKVISQFLDTPVPSPGLFFILLPANGKVRLASKLLLFGQCVWCSFFSLRLLVPQRLQRRLLALLLPFSPLSAAFYPVLLLIIAQITYRDTFFRRRTQFFLLLSGRIASGYN